MEIEWDENKRLSNIKKHGIDFEYAALIFFNLYVSKFDDREDYGELREISLGMIDGIVIAVTHTEREGSIRIISARKGDRKEHDYYYKNIA